MKESICLCVTVKERQTDRHREGDRESAERQRLCLCWGEREGERKNEWIDR